MDSILIALIIPCLFVGFIPKKWNILVKYLILLIFYMVPFLFGIKYISSILKFNSLSHYDLASIVN